MYLCRAINNLGQKKYQKMKKILVIDCETTGLHNTKETPTSENYTKFARMLSVSATLYDEFGVAIDAMNEYIKVEFEIDKTGKPIKSWFIGSGEKIEMKKL